MSAPLRQPPLRADLSDLNLGLTESSGQVLAFDELEASYLRMKRELQAAARVQRGLLPQSAVHADGARFAWRFLPSSELGGDMFDVVQLDRSHYALYMLDVAGHGVSQLLSHMPVGSLLLEGRGESELSPLPLAPAKVAEHLNERFPMDGEHRQYFTFLYGVLDLERARFLYVAAGHPGPVLVHRERDLTFLGLSFSSSTVRRISSAIPLS